MKNVTSTAEPVKNEADVGGDCPDLAAYVVKSCPRFTSTILSVPTSGTSLSASVLGFGLAVR